MGISRDRRHKRRLTGGRRSIHQKKRKFEMGRPTSGTRIGEKRVHVVRVRGGNLKYRAMRLETGNFSWPSQCVTRKTRVIDVVYNASNNELVRTKTLVKNAIIQVDATPFRQWYEQHYNAQLGKKSKKADADKAEAKSPSKHLLKKYKQRSELVGALEQNLKDQFASGRLYAAISSRPGQCGRCDGYVLEQKELEFYLKKIAKKK